MPTNFTGPLLENGDARGTREAFANLPQGCEPDFVYYTNDFLTARDYAAADWVVTETQAGATQALAADELGGALLLTNSAADNDVNQLQGTEETWKLTVGKKLRLEARFKISDATLSALFIGLATTDTTIIAGTTDSVGFRKALASTSLVAITEDNTTETTTAAATVVADTYIVASLLWDGQSSVKFFINRALVATHTTNIEQTNKLALTITLQNGEAAAKTMTVDYIDVAMER